MNLHLFALLFTGGCATVGTMQTADTVGRGAFQLGVEPGAWGVSTQGVGVTVPQIGVSFRYGATDTIDLGARLGTSGLEVLSKFQLTDPAQENFVVSIAPSAGGFTLGAGGASTTFFSFQVPVLLGIGVGPHQVVLGPKLREQSVFATLDGDSVVAHEIGIGSSLGLAIRLGDVVTLLPEVAFVAPIATFASSGGRSDSGTGGGLYSQYTFGLLFDLGK